MVADLQEAGTAAVTALRDVERAAPRGDHARVVLLSRGAPEDGCRRVQMAQRLPLCRVGHAQCPVHRDAVARELPDEEEDGDRGRAVRIREVHRLGHPDELDALGGELPDGVHRVVGRPVEGAAVDARKAHGRWVAVLPQRQFRRHRVAPSAPVAARAGTSDVSSPCSPAPSRRSRSWLATAGATCTY